MHLKRFIATFCFFLLPPMACAAGGTETWTAWVSDQACGAEHTTAGGASCVRKCKRGGSSIGHPEWKPQAVVLVRESDKTVWLVENPESLDGRDGERLQAIVTVDPGKKTVHVNSVAKSPEPKTP